MTSVLLSAAVGVVLVWSVQGRCINCSCCLCSERLYLWNRQLSLLSSLFTSCYSFFFSVKWNAFSPLWVCSFYPPKAVISPKGTKNSLFFKQSSCLKNGFEGFSVLGTETEVSRDLLAYYVVCRAAAAGGRGGVIFYDPYFRTDPGVSGSTWRFPWSQNWNPRRIGWEKAIKRY